MWKSSTLEEVEACPLADGANARRLRGARRLPRVVLGAQPRHELRRVQRRVHCQLLRDREQRVRELGDRQLLARRLQNAHTIRRQVELPLRNQLLSNHSEQLAQLQWHAHNGGGEVLEVDGERGLDAAGARHDRAALEHAAHDAQRVVQRALHLVQRVVVRPAQDDARGRARLRPAHKQRSNSGHAGHIPHTIT